MKETKGRWCRLVAPIIFSAHVLVGCGGGGSSDAAPEPTPLPSVLQISGPTEAAQQVGQPMAFGHNATDGMGTLAYAWDFGDGGSSTEASPSHTYSAAGTFDVQLTVTNEAGDSRMSKVSVRVADVALVQGLVCSQPGQQGWCWKQPLPQGEAINSTFFINENTAFAAGNHGVLLKTVDSGASWVRMASGTEFPLRKVVFSGPNDGAVAGDNGLLLTTSDGGARWDSLQLPTTVDPDSLKSLGGKTLWISGSYALSSSLISNDAGKTWGPYNAGATDGGCYAKKAEAVSASEAWCLDYSYDASSPLRRTTDAGNTWTAPGLPAASTNFYRDYKSLSAVSGMVAVLVVDNGYTSDFNYVVRQRLYTSTNGGGSWDSLVLTPPNDPYSAPYASVEFYDTRRGVLRCGYTASCRDRTTNDGGVTWTDVTSPEPSPGGPYFVRRYGYSLLVASGNAGELLLSKDAGANWRDVSVAGKGDDVRFVTFFNGREGVTVSDGVGIQVRVTADGGKTWKVRSLPSYRSVVGLQFLPDASIGWMVTSGGEVFRSTDKGLTWLQVLDPFAGSETPDVSGVHFLDAQNGWLVSSYGGTQSSLYRTTDGGSTWSPVPEVSRSLSSVSFGDQQHGVAVGAEGQVLVTQDGGVSWTLRPSGITDGLTKVQFADASTVVALGASGQIIRSVDAGLTWSRAAVASTQAMRDVQFLSAQLGHAVGDGGTVLRTLDGGATWLPLPTGTDRNLNAVFFLDAETAWLAGDNGTLLVTAFGGM